MRDVSPPDNLRYLFFSDPKFIDNVCSHVSNGGSLVDMANAAGVRYCDIMNQIRCRSDYSGRYEQALNDREEWLKDSILKELKSLMLDKSEEDDLSGAQKRAQAKDRLRAIELLGKHLSMFIVKHEVKGSITLDQLILATQDKQKAQE